MEAVLDRGHTASCQALGDYLKQVGEIGCIVYGGELAHPLISMRIVFVHT
jgi:hypothetical protein